MNAEAPTPSSYSGNDKVWILLCHLSLFIGVPFLLPFIVYLAMKNENPTVTYHAKESLNFHLSCLLYALISIPLCLVLIGFVSLFVIGLASVIFAIVAAIKVSEGIPYRYPFTIRLF